jgi:hypothetical protein
VELTCGVGLVGLVAAHLLYQARNRQPIAHFIRQHV